MIKRGIVVVLCLAGVGWTQPGYVPAPENLEAREWFQDVKFGLFTQWGIYSLLGSGEGGMQIKKISIRDYERLASFFNPTDFDPDAWVFNITDRNDKSSRDLVRAPGTNANFLLNVGPMPDGRIQPEFVDTLRVSGSVARTIRGDDLRDAGRSGARKGMGGDHPGRRNGVGPCAQPDRRPCVPFGLQKEGSHMPSLPQRREKVRL